METGFWKKLPRPILAMAPMANVTDAAFRRQFAECSGAALGKFVFWTEFVSVEGLLSKGRGQLMADLRFGGDEHPIVAQIFGSKPEQFEKVAAELAGMGFDGIDINMGCPDAGVEKSGAGAALIKNPKLAKEIIRAAKSGAGKLPVSVKTRLGYAKPEIETWIPALLEEKLAALIIHLRTRKEMSDAPAHWELMPRIVELRNRISPETLILGNGDVNSPEEARSRISEAGADGMMVGRGLFGNPWFFSGTTPTVREKLKRMVAHTELFEKMFKSNKTKTEGKLKNFEVMKKHFKAYCTGFDGAKELRIRLMETEHAEEARKIAEEFIGTLR
ncbi:MAG: tRNA-dihydrouridine synthase [Patescibacteria group bacterium]|nr:tRNA-dihydrouridine synthase [Patescibacteria group bacterium]